MRNSLPRRTVLAGLAAAAATPALAAPKVVTILGDSITAGYGLPSRDALPVQLEAALRQAGLDVRVRGAGVSGDTTAGGLSRLNWSVRDDTAVCVIALGGNDLLQGVDPKTMKANLDAIISRLKARRIKVVLAGMHAPVVFAGEYGRQYNAAFSDLARKHKAPFYPFLLDGVMGVRALNQKDGIHPNAAGVKVIVNKLAPVVKRAL